jgi:hypothetical protein
MYTKPGNAQLCQTYCFNLLAVIVAEEPCCPS